MRAVLSCAGAVAYTGRDTIMMGQRLREVLCVRCMARSWLRDEQGYCPKATPLVEGGPACALVGAESCAA